jgi:5-methylcytosine-specific restriction enzyme A
MSRAFDRFRPAAHKRGYDHEWFVASRHYRQAFPFCVGCAAIGVSRPSRVVDHIVPHDGNRQLFWNTSNWQACCTWHHDAIKPALERAWRQKQITASELALSSATAIKLTREKHRPAIGADGFPIAGT